MSLLKKRSFFLTKISNKINNLLNLSINIVNKMKTLPNKRHMQHLLSSQKRNNSNNNQILLGEEINNSKVIPNKRTKTNPILNTKVITNQTMDILPKLNPKKLIETNTVTKENTQITRTGDFEFENLQNVIPKVSKYLNQISDSDPQYIPKEETTK